MIDTPQPSRQLRAEAAVWLARLRADNRTLDEIRYFQAWIAADIAHFTAFEQVSAVWETSGGISLNAGHREEKKTTAVGRRGLLAGLGLLIVTGGTVSVWRSAQANVYTTDVGEQKHLVLRDGTQVFLDTDTCLEVRLNKESRSAALRYGQASFRVVPDSAGPFAIEAADRMVTAAQSRFDVRRERGSEQVAIVVIQGRAALNPLFGEEARGFFHVNAGQRLVAVPAKAPIITKADLVALLAWHHGQAAFDTTLLPEAVLEMNRYSTRKLEIVDPRISSLRLSGVYSVGDNAAFAASVEKVLPIKARFTEDRIELVSTTFRMPQG